MAQSRSFASLGPVSLLFERLPNLREVVKAGMAFQHHLNDVVNISLDDDDETACVRIDLLPEFWSVQVFDNAVAMAYRVLLGASGNRWKPACIHLMRREPKDIGMWRRYYSAPIEFGASFNGLSSSSEALLIPNPLADEEMARHARHLLHLIPQNQKPRGASDRVRRVISLLLPSGRASLDQVAGQLALSPRSLQRHLVEEGRTFADVLENVRRDLAKSYLAGSAQPITTIAPMLGYASPSSFTRWFAGAFGMSPQAWRAVQDAAAESSRHIHVPRH
jgi:AraC-like DNA-binding protein